MITETWHNNIFRVILFLCTPSFFAADFDWQKELRWDWSTLDYSWQNLELPDSFTFGVATSASHLEGTASDHGKFIKNNFTESPKKKTATDYVACNHWLMWQEDVQHIKNLGVDSYRFSIGWDRIEPVKGQYDQNAINHYKELVKELKRNDIEPWICLYHFKHPVWVEESDGWLNQENIDRFVYFCEKIFQELHDEVTYWLTFNEPVAYAAESYITGRYPPHYGKGIFSSTLGFIYAGRVVKNMLEAHVRMYQSCKQIDESAQIGLIHMFHIIDPYTNNLIERFIATQANQLINDTTLNFFKHGTFSWINLVSHTNELALKSLDFIGINYYRHQIASFGIRNKKNGIINARIDEPKTSDLGYSIYPEGLYRSIKKAAELSIPIYVTEVGIADKSNTQRDEFIRQHLWTIKEALAEGIDIRGCFYWTLMERCGSYGLYQVDSNTFSRILRPDMHEFVSYLNNHHKK